MKKITAVALLSALIAAPAMAENSGVYVGLDYSKLTMTNISPSPQPDAGFRIVGGYNFSPMLAAEVGLSMNGSSTSVGGTVTPKTTHVAAVASYPFSDGFSVLAKLGYAMNELTGSATTGCGANCKQSGLMYGIGAQFNISQQLGVRAQYEFLGDFTKNNAPNVGGSSMNVGIIFGF